MLTMDGLLRLMFEKNASDLHLTEGVPPMLRIDGEIVASDLEKIKPESSEALIYSVLLDEQRKRLERQSSVNVSFGIESLGRVRMMAYRQRGVLSATVRAIPGEPPALEALGLPAVSGDIVQLPKGLVLVCGPAGAGKTTTLAAMLNWINEHKSVHILTLEDPLEFLHANKKSIVNQREIGTDVPSYAQALREVRRQDPDVVLIGDLTDTESIQAALDLAENGHLVLAAVPMPTSIQALDYVIENFPPHLQYRVRVQLSYVLQAILAQQLLPRGYSAGRVAACEVLIPTSAARNLIREEQEHQIYAMMQTGSEYGMQTMNQSLFELYQKQLVTYNEIFSRTTDAKDLQSLVKGTT